MMTTVVLAKIYPGSGRPDRFEVRSEGDTEGINRLLEGFGYGVVEWGKPDDYTEGDAWKEYTYQDADNFTQWK